MAESVAALEAFDARSDRVAKVAIDPLSGFGQEVFARSWSRLQFVQPTPATPLDMASADYLLVTPGARFVTEGLPETWGPQAPLLQVQSPQGRFGLDLYDNPGRE